MAEAQRTYRPGEHPDLEPPRASTGVLGWLRANLFSSWTNSVLTVLAVYFIYITVAPVVEWGFTSSVIGGKSRYRCDLGRRLANLGEAIDKADLTRLTDPATQDQLDNARDFLNQYLTLATMKPKQGYEDAGLPPALARLHKSIDVPTVKTELAAAVKAGDAKRIAANFAALRPLISAGAAGGACWTFSKVWFGQFIYGRYPAEERWRVDLAFLILLFAAVPLFIPRVKGKRWIGAFLLIGYPIIAYVLFYGGVAGLQVVETTLWGGLFLTLVISGVGIVFSLPVGVVLALGRRSHMPIIRALCVTFIEFWRGVPLITVLFMASVMFPLFLPEGMNFDKLVRALAGVAFFASAYMAEVVRGGLQAIPTGQYEAASAMGLSYWRSMGLVILPQALKIVIPGIVNTFIGLFKDTTLVLIIGLFDLLGMVQLGATNPSWLGFVTEGYVFAAVGFWIFCFGMSRYSVGLERKLHTGY